MPSKKHKSVVLRFPVAAPFLHTDPVEECAQRVVHNPRVVAAMQQLATAIAVAMAREPQQMKGGA